MKTSKYESQATIQRRLDNTDKVIELYKIHRTFKKVAELVKMDHRTVARIIKDNNINYKGRGFASQKVLDNPFENASFEDKSYWIGFIAGDGYLSQNKFAISIVSIDREIIDNFKTFVGEGISESWRLDNSGYVYTARFSHKDAHNYLTKRGVTSKKSLTLKFNVKLNWSIVRGLFDADGSFSQNRFKITSGSKFVVKQLEEFFNSEGFNTVVKYKSPTNKILDIYILGGKPKLIELYNKLYHSECKYCLSRKKDSIGRFIQ
jgi:hypothetical protein